MLTEASIGELIEREYQRARELYPRWVHPFAGFSFSRSRRCYGQARHDGHMLISRSFLGTQAVADLEDTVRHEFAHLIAGIRARHGAPWRVIAQSLGARPRATGQSIDAGLNERMSDAPFTLLAVLQGGEERVLRKVFRRSRRYLDYRLGHRGQRYTVSGIAVERFRYIDHRIDKGIDQREETVAQRVTGL